MTDRINVTKTSLPPMEEYIEEISSMWENHWITNMGEKHLQLEEKLKEYLNADYITLFTNGHLALENIIAAYGLKGEIITTPFTFASTTHAIVRNGIKPVFCDVDPDTCTLDVNKIEELITPETSAIIPVHVYGNICDAEAIQEISDKHNIKVIYDGAHAFGESYKGKNISQYGDATMFSFHATKVFNTVEGGAATYSDPELQSRLNYIKNFGIPGEDRIVYAGGNAKMSEFHAAMGLCNLRHLEEYKAGRKQVVERYQKNLSNIEGLRIWKKQEEVESNYAYFPVFFESNGYDRNHVSDQLKEHNIFARKYFYPLTNNNEWYGNHGSETPVALRLSEQVLTLPLYPDLPLETVDEICDIIIHSKL